MFWGLQFVTFKIMYVLFNFQAPSQMAGPLVHRVKGRKGGAGAQGK